MALVSITEVFGHPTGDLSAKSVSDRNQKWCPFREMQCNKGRLEDPLGICTFGDEVRASAVCPSRFLEDGRIFQDAGRLAFGRGMQVLVAPEIRILQIPGGRVRKIGKVDYIIGQVDARGVVTDFAAVEVQSVYFSGRSIRPAFSSFLSTGQVPQGSDRRLDYRSSAQKRLMPQLSLKVPVFRRWGKRFFVAVDHLFFENLPPLRTVESVDNSEVTWLVYPLEAAGGRYRLGEPTVRFTLWEDVISALREGREPTPAEVISELNAKKDAYRTIRT